MTASRSAGPGLGPLDHWLGDPVRSSLRLPAAVLLLLGAAAHAPLIEMHMMEAPYVGWLFLVLTIVLVELGALVALYDVGVVYLVSLLVTVLALAAYLVSRSVGMPEIHDDIGNWAEPLGLLAITAECGAAALCLVVLHRRRSH